MPPDKAEHRRQARRRRRLLAIDAPTAAEDAASLAPAWLFRTGQVVALYVPAGSELDPKPLRLRLETAGVRIALPVVTARDAALTFRLCSRDAHAPDLLGLPGPPDHALAVRPAVIVTPLLAFDRRGVRLGQGGGYYDRTLMALRPDGPVRAIGLAYAGQAVESLPADVFDQPLDGVLTETAYLEFKGDA
jgi:5-formyltetrahydrofolate cyclo-ligase